MTTLCTVGVMSEAAMLVMLGEDLVMLVMLDEDLVMLVMLGEDLVMLVILGERLVKTMDPPVFVLSSTASV